MAVVPPLNNFMGPEGDTVTVAQQLLNTEYFPGSCWVRAGTCVFGLFMRAGCADAAWMRGGSLDTSMGAGRRCLATRAGGVR
jgi:hypothetical protein